METFDLEINLVDSVTKNANRAASGVTKVDVAARSANKELASLGKQFEKVGFATARAQHRQQQAFASSWEKIGLAAARAQHRAAEAAKRKTFSHGFREGLGLDRLTSASFAGSFMAEGAFKIADAFVSGAEKAVEVIYDGIRSAFAGASREETSRVRERNILGEAGGKAFRENVNFSGLTPFSSLETRSQMLRLRRAGLSQAASRQALATANDIGGPDAGEVEGVLGQIQHIYTQRGVTRKQLKELLGDIGSNIPDFYKAIGKKMRLSAKDAEKKLDKGGADPQLIVNMLTQAVNKRQGGIAGTGGARFVRTLAGEWKKLTELPDEYYQKLADSPAYDRAKEALGSLLAKLDPESENGRQIMDSLGKAFEDIVGYVDKLATADGINQLTDSIKTAIEVTDSLVHGLKEVIDLASGETISKMLFQGDKGTQRVNEALYQRGLMSDTDYRDYIRSLKLSPSEKVDLQNAGKKQGYDYGFGSMTQLAPNITAVRRPPVARNAEPASNPAGSGRAVNMNVTNHVHVHTDGEDKNEAHERAGHELKKHMVSAGERAAAELGG